MRAPPMTISILAFIAIAAVAVGRPADGWAQSEDDAVRDANQSFYRNLSEGDIFGLMQVWSASDDIISVDTRGTVSWGRPAVEDAWQGVMTRFPNRLVTMNNPVVRRNGDVAWVLGNETFNAANAQGGRVEFTSSAINLFVREAGEWRMVFHQATVQQQR